MPVIPAPEQAPNISLGSNVPVATALRTGVQGLSGSFIVEFIEAFEIYDFTERQYGLAVALFGMILAFGQNLWEKHRGKKFYGATPEGGVLPPKPEEGHYDVPGIVVIVAIAVVVWLVMWQLIIK